jgi:hypothetical protein
MVIQSDENEANGCWNSLDSQKQWQQWFKDGATKSSSELHREVFLTWFTIVSRMKLFRRLDSPSEASLTCTAHATARIHESGGNELVSSIESWRGRRRQPAVTELRCTQKGIRRGVQKRFRRPHRIWFLSRRVRPGLKPMRCASEEMCALTTGHGYW